MPESPQPRFTDLDEFGAYLRTTGSGVAKAIVLPIVLASAERMVERYCRRRFAPEPVLSDEYTRQVVSIVGSVGSSLPPQVAGTLGLSFGGNPVAPALALPVSASQLQAALTALPNVGAGNVVCSGGPLPSYPIDVVWAGSLTGAQEEIVADSSGLSGGYAVVSDAGFDSLPPVAKRFTTRGAVEVSLPDLRAVSASPDPRIPNSGGIQLAGRKLLSSQYDLGYDAYAAGGADEAIGSSYAEPSTSIRLGYGWGSGRALSQSFAFVAPIGFYANDLTITGRWGWLPTPEDVRELVYIVGARGAAERDARFTDAYQTAEGAVLSFFKQLPARGQMIADSYRKPNFAVV